jgi:capsular exopolysaccharide synthesis family protein
MNDSSEVKLHFLDYWKVVKVRWGIVLVTFLAVVITAGITCFFLPRQFYSRVMIEVKPDTNRPVSIYNNDEGHSGSTDPRFAPTQMQIIRSKQILLQVIDRLDLIKAWSVNGASYNPESAFNKLSRMLNVDAQRGTDLIEIGVYDTNATEAANIANSLASIYQERRREDQTDMVDKGLAQLKDLVNDQRDLVEKAAARASTIRTEEGIVDTSPETNEVVNSPDTVSVTNIQQQADEASIEVGKLKAQLEQVDKLTPDQLMVALQTLNIEDPTVGKVLPLYQQAMADRAQMLAGGLGVNHPRIKSLDAQVSVYQEQLSAAITALHSTLATKLSIAENNLARIKENLAQNRKDFIASKSQTADYIQAKSNYIQAKAILAAAEQKYYTAKMEVQISMVPAKIWETAVAANGPSKPNIPAYIMLSVVLGLGLGVGLAFFIEYLDTSVKTLEDAEKYLNVPVLAVIPKGISLLIKSKLESADAEAYRILRTNIEFNRPNPDANTITLISGGPGEGKSTTLNNLAYTCAKGGYRVLVVDADLRRPTQHQIFNVPNRKGLTDYLLGNTNYHDCIVQTSVENLSFLPSGLLPQDSVGILNSQRMVDMVAQVKREFDLVFFDSPPILGVSDGAVIASEVDMTVMVIQHRRFPRSMLQRVKQAVTGAGGQLVGAVLNNVDTRHDAGYQYYTNYTQYYSTPRHESRDPQERPHAEVARFPETRRPAAHGEQY